MARLPRLGTNQVRRRRTENRLRRLLGLLHQRDLTEEGFSIPAQREACVRHIRDLGWDLVDEYSDRGESARSADRPQLQAMLRRITEDRDVEAVVVHKIDRLARNIEDHVAIRAVLRRCGVSLVSVTEKL